MGPGLWKRLVFEEPFTALSLPKALQISVPFPPNRVETHPLLPHHWDIHIKPSPKVPKVERFVFFRGISKRSSRDGVTMGVASFRRGGSNPSCRSCWVGHCLRNDRAPYPRVSRRRCLRVRSLPLAYQPLTLNIFGLR